MHLGKLFIAPSLSKSNGTFAPTPEGDNSTTLSPSTGNVTDETVVQFLTRTLTIDASLETPGTAQNDALTALETNFPDLDPVNGVDDQRTITQVYSLNTLYFSMSGDSWMMNTNWLGPMTPCDGWTGLICDDQLEIINLDLSANDLFGTLPSEIRGLSNLRMWKILQTFIDRIPRFRLTLFLSTHGLQNFS